MTFKPIEALFFPQRSFEPVVFRPITICGRHSSAGQFTLATHDVPIPTLWLDFCGNLHH
ncbi:hypothetical protein [Marivita lacus]|uniref:hypothetical protein n=1 Tax=Marivita lacus TaxID=1323742 RepID=UPI00166C6EDA|nr:hypothetical protein [Marivita lacus]